MEPSRFFQHYRRYPMTKSYYKVIDGERYDRHMLEIADESIEGQGDGRISVKDAKKLYEAIVDGNKITKIEEKSLVYIQENYKFTDAADKWLINELEMWKSRKKPSKRPSVKSRTKRKPSYSPAATFSEAHKAETEVKTIKTTKIVETLPQKPATEQEEQSTKTIETVKAPSQKQVKEPEKQPTKVIETDETPSSKPPIDQEEQVTKAIGTIKTPLQHPEPIQKQVSTGSSSGIWKKLAFLFLILLPIAFFGGQALVVKKTNPDFEKAQAELEEKLRLESHNLEIAKAEIKKLKDQINTQKTSLDTTMTKTKEPGDTIKNDSSKLSDKLSVALLQHLGNDFDNQKIQFDKKNLIISFLPKQPFFESNGTALKPVLRRKLQQVFPKFVQTIKAYKNEITQIQFQGHSSSKWKNASSTRDAYLKNMKLSNARAESTLKYCLDLTEVKREQEWLIKHMTSTGFSSLRPALNQDKTENEIRSRRISIAIIVRNKQLK